MGMFSLKVQMFEEICRFDIRWGMSDSLLHNIEVSCTQNVPGESGVQKVAVVWNNQIRRDLCMSNRIECVQAMENMTLHG